MATNYQQTIDLTATTLYIQIAPNQGLGTIFISVVDSTTGLQKRAAQIAIDDQGNMTDEFGNQLGNALTVPGVPPTIQQDVLDVVAAVEAVQAYLAQSGNLGV